MDIWPNFFVTSIPSPLKKKKSIYSTESCKDDISSSLTVGSQDTPHFFEGRTHLGTGQCCREGVVTDGCSLLCVVHIHLIKKEIISNTYLMLKAVNQQPSRAISHRSMCKCSNHHCSRSLWHQRAGTDSLSRGEGGGYAGAARRQVVRHWVFNHPQKLLRTISGPDTQLVQQLNWDRRRGEGILWRSAQERSLGYIIIIHASKTGFFVLNLHKDQYSILYVVYTQRIQQW